MSDGIKGGAHAAIRHDSAHKHVSGEAIYVDDHPPFRTLYYACVGGSAVAHGRIKNVDLDAVTASQVFDGELPLGHVEHRVLS